ncbi:hypothetical protein SMB57_003855 [Cronobacter sakazakii]|nr:hypothetical protein [Cronobacter sakazakii]
MSTISNERIEQIMTRCVPFHGECAAPVSVIEVKAMATELLALRKERERAEPVACPKCGNTGLADSGGVQPWGEPILIDCDCRYAPATHETDTTSHQFESLAGKVVGGSDGFECTPVADLYELLTKCGECYDYTTSAKVAADWIKEGYSAREYVKLDRLQEALLFAAPEPCK